MLLYVSVIAFGLAAFQIVKYFDPSYGNSVSQDLTNLIVLLPMFLGLQYFKRGIVNQYQLQELKAKTVETELNALRAQVNPHFLFNTLNNLYGVNQVDPRKGSEMILELSEVMRYHLELSSIKKISIQEELDLIKSYISLEQLRLNDNCTLELDFTPIDKSISISPLLLIPFVENAFKHGTHPTKCCFVTIKMMATNQSLEFKIKNSVISNRNAVQTNIGLANTKRRLELLYPKRYELSIDNDSKEFSVELKIKIND